MRYNVIIGDVVHSVSELDVNRADKSSRISFRDVGFDGCQRRASDSSFEAAR